MTVPPVLLVNPGLKPGGMTVDLNNLARGLAQRGVQVDRAGTGRSAARIMRATRPLVHIFGCLPSSAIFATMALARCQRLPLVWTPTFHPIRPKTYGRSVPHVAMRGFDAIAPLAARHVDAVIALTPEESAYFRLLGALRVEVIPHGVETLAPPVGPESLRRFRERHNLGDAPVVVVVGRDSPRHKGLTFCLDTFDRLRALVPDAQLVLVGGLGASSLRAAHTPGVHLLGWVDAADRDLAIATADVLFVPSAYEALSRAVLEGWALRTAVVSSHRVALASLLAAEHAGDVVLFGDTENAADIIAHLLRDETRRHRYVTTGLQLIERQFLLTDIVDRVVTLYNELATTTSPRAWASDDSRCSDHGHQLA